MWHDISLWFWFAFSWVNNDVEHLFMYLLAVCISSLEKTSIQILRPFLIWLFSFFFYWFIYIFILTPYQIYDSQIFSPSWWVPFSFYWWFPLLCRAFLFDVDSLVCFCFCCLCFWCQTQKMVVKTHIKKLSHWVSFSEFYGSKFHI